MRLSYTTTVLKDEGSSATGLVVPEEIILQLGAGKRPKVIVTLNKYTYRSTAAVYGGKYFIPLSAEHRDAAGVKANDIVTVTLELDTELRIIEIPPDLALMLSQIPGLSTRFDALAYTTRKEYVRLLESAKAPETRARRLNKIITEISG